MHPSFCVLVSLAALVLSTTGVHATQFELEGGRSTTDRASTPAIFLERTGEARGMGAGAFSWSSDVSVGWIKGRNGPSNHEGLSARHDVALLAAGARLQYALPGAKSGSLFFSFQPALTSGRTPSLSSGYEFVSTLGWQGERFSFQVRHISNGGLHEPNHGETMALVGLRF